MKKYVKPELIYEHFELSQQIAACQFDLHNQGDETLCKFIGDAGFGTMVIFRDVCGNGDEDESIRAESYCYHNSTAAFGIFNS